MGFSSHGSSVRHMGLLVWLVERTSGCRPVCRGSSHARGSSTRRMRCELARLQWSHPTTVIGPNASCETILID